MGGGGGGWWGFFFNDTATTEIYTLSLHDALPICDAHIVKGLIAVLLEIYNGRTAEEILAVDIKQAITELGFEQHLSPNRANGLNSMVERIRALAAQEAGEARA